MDLYTGQINEFVDWVTGKDTFTGRDVTGGLPVSGGSIREFLLERLKRPFVLKEDTTNNLYRMFSSEDAYQLWLENPSDNAALEIFNFVRPSDYKLTFTGLNNSSRYVRYGDTEDINNRIQFSWSIENDEGQSSEGLAVTYQIINASTGKNTTFTQWYNHGQSEDFSIYKYLKPGENTIIISGRGLESGARNSTQFTIIMLELSVESQFLFFKKYSGNQYMNIPCYFNRNDDRGTAKVYYIIDSDANKQYTTDVLSGSGTQVNVEKNIMLDLEPGMHTLLIWAQATYNNGNTTINTNLLYFTFVVVTPEISAQKYIPISTSFNNGSYPFTELILTTQQYLETQIKWGYLTEALQSDSRITVDWLLYESEEDQNPTLLSNITANLELQSDDLQFIPTLYSSYDNNSRPLTFLSAQYNGTELLRIPIQILQNTEIVLSETVPYSFKLSAYGKTNDSADKESWGTADVTFTNILWDPNSGWYENSFRTSGTNRYAIINYKPFLTLDINDQGCTIEIEFETEKVNEDFDVLITIGNAERARIQITPTRASLFNNANQEVVYTNYKSNERLKLAFIIIGTSAVNYPENERGLAYIVNNGILERAQSASGGVYTNDGLIKIGGSNSGIRVYNMRVYSYPITYTQAYNNFLYDSDDKADIYYRNNIIGIGDRISYDLCKNKIDTILISGDLSKILNQLNDKESSESEVTVERICPFDTTKNFKINHAKIRKHGLSTLNYPISSMKIWFNQSNTTGVVPTFEITPQDPIQYNKNRYRMKSDSIPTNKFVLQANYADSSGTHNGGFQRLIQSTWYNANIDDKYILRTEPLLFVSIPSVDKEKYNLAAVWADYNPNKAFPYQIRVSPDSFPCVVFYQNEGEETQTFLGQYVFMEDKKSDHLYGERSIYNIPSDPFCLTVQHKDDDTKANRIWNNDKVLRIEVVGSNDTYSSYMTTDGFTDVENIVDETTGNILGQRFKWERSFEMIYPDPDDVAGHKPGDVSNKGKIYTDDTTKFSENSEFVETVQPFIDWYNWLVGTRNNYSQMGYASGQEAFRATAADHLDLYKMAAYYIFAMRFGLVDSLERNAQLKTYDGIHWHYEPWDMDIALGNKNDGGIAYDPPINRNTLLPGSITTYAYSGRSANDNGQIITTNWLWDLLEDWPEWNRIVENVAEALYKAGLNYNNVVEMLDENYANAWNETIYNKSGHYKYIEARDDNKWLNWLQGSRMTHRHWWLSTSMDYYDAIWFCGDYKTHRIYITANVSDGSNAQIHITPNKATYMVILKEGETIARPYVAPSEPMNYTVPVLNTKNPFHIYGANFMEEVDFSEIAQGLQSITWGGVYSNVLGSPLKILNLGTVCTQSGDNYVTTLATTSLDILSGGAECFENLQSLNVRGHANLTSMREFIYDKNVSSLKNFYGMGSGLTNFYSSKAGNEFDVVELPSTINVLSLNNSTWNLLSFWDAEVNQNNQATLSIYLNHGSFVPDTVETLELTGTSCQDFNSINLVRSWLKSISESGNDLSNYTFNADKIRWTADTVGNLNLLKYEELSVIAQINHNLRGYIVLKNEGSDLTPTQLAQVKEWFGESVFDRNSSGLIVDHERNYIQITLGGDTTVINGEVYLTEGGRASLNATEFMLAAETDNSYSWAISSTEQGVTPGTSYLGCRIISSAISTDGVAYLQTSESTVGLDYDIKLYVSAKGNTYSTTIHIIAAKYPTSILFNLEDKGTIRSKLNSQYILYPASGTEVLFTAVPAQNYTATIKSIVYTVSGNGNSSVMYNTQTKVSTFEDWTDENLILSTSGNSIRVGWTNPMLENGQRNLFNVTAEITFISNVKRTVSQDILVMDDTTPILTTYNTALYEVITNAWEAQYGEEFNSNEIYMSDLLSLTESVTFSGVNNLNDIICPNTGQSILVYLENVTELNFDNLSSLTSIVSGYNLFTFNANTKLETFSAAYCAGLTEDLDFSNCPVLESVNINGCTVNCIFAEDTVLNYFNAGNPSNITLIRPTRLTATNLNVQSLSRVSNNKFYLDIENPVLNNAYSLADKILSVSGSSNNNDIKIIQSRQITEYDVSSDILERIVYAYNGSYTNANNIEGKVLLNEGTYTNITERLPQFTKLDVTLYNNRVYIDFADSNVGNICKSQWGDGTGLLTSAAASVSTISQNVFKGNTSIVNFEELKYFISYTVIEQYQAYYTEQNGLFSGCTNLQTLDFTNILRIHGDFKGCSNLREIKNFNGTHICGVSGSSFVNVESLFGGSRVLTTINLSNVRILHGGFANCTSLTNIGNLSNATLIGRSSFACCLSLSIAVNCPNLQAIGNDTNAGMFFDTAITAVDNLGQLDALKDGTSFISWLINKDRVGCFAHCLSLKHVILPDTMTYIGKYSFNGDSNIDYFKILATTPPTLGATNSSSNDFPFYGCKATCKYYVPDASVSTYKAASGWSEIESKIYPLSQFATDFPDE